MQVLLGYMQVLLAYMQVLLAYMQVLLAYMQVLLAYMQQKFKIVCNVTDLQEAYKHLCSPYVLTELHVTYIQCLPTEGIKTIAFNIHICRNFQISIR